MKVRIHAIAGLIGLMTILTFWTSTVASELLGRPETIAAVKAMILWGMLILVPAMITVAASGRSLVRGRSGEAVQAKARRMPIIALNGLLILVPCAIYLSGKAGSGDLDNWFYGVQALELMAGATNIVLMSLNARDGLRLTGRFRKPSVRPA